MATPDSTSRFILEPVTPDEHGPRYQVSWGEDGLDGHALVSGRGALGKARLIKQAPDLRAFAEQVLAQAKLKEGREWEILAAQAQAALGEE